MKKVTNIYILADTSFKMINKVGRLQSSIVRMKRALNFVPAKTNLHTWGYNDKARILSPTCQIKASGNPNLGEGLKMLENIILYQRKVPKQQTRSIFILYASDSVLRGWEQPLNDLFKLKEFAFGLRYVVTCGTPDNYTKKAFITFTDTPDRILPYFSENRLCSLVKSL